MPTTLPQTELLAEALEFLWDHGYRNSNINTLVHRTSLNRHSLYAHFGSKRQLATAAVLHYRARLRDEFARLPLRAPLDPARLAEAWQHPPAGSCLERLRRRGCFARRLANEHEDGLNGNGQGHAEMHSAEAAALLREQLLRSPTGLSTARRDALGAVLLAELEPGLVGDLTASLAALLGERSGEQAS